MNKTSSMAFALVKLLIALKEYQKFNGQKNDRDAYLFQLGEWAMGETKERPKPEDFGIEVSDD